MEMIEKLTWMIADEFVESFDTLWSVMLVEEEKEEQLRSFAKTA